MMTSGAMARAFTMEHQPTLTRVTAPYTEIGEVFKTLFLKEEYNKFPIHLLYHSPEDLTKECLEKYRSQKYTVLTSKYTVYYIRYWLKIYPKSEKTLCCSVLRLVYLSGSYIFDNRENLENDRIISGPYFFSQGHIFHFNPNLMSVLSDTKSAIFKTL